MIRRAAAAALPWSGVASGVLLVIAAVYVVVLAMMGGFQWVIDFAPSPPPWVQTALTIWLGMFALYAIAVLIFTLSLAVLQYVTERRRLVVGGLIALVVGMLCLPIAPVTQVGFLGLAIYLGTANVVGLRSKQLHGLSVAFGLAAAALLLGVAVFGLATWGFVFPALAFYAAWAVSIGIVGLRRLGAAPPPASSQAALQSGPGDR